MFFAMRWARSNNACRGGSPATRRLRINSSFSRMTHASTASLMSTALIDSTEDASDSEAVTSTPDININPPQYDVFNDDLLVVELDDIGACSLPQCLPKPPSVNGRRASPPLHAPLVDGRRREPGAPSFVLRRESWPGAQATTAGTPSAAAALQRMAGGRFTDDGELHDKPAHAMPLTSARQHPETQTENQAGHSSERAVEGSQSTRCWRGLATGYWHGARGWPIRHLQPMRLSAFSKTAIVAGFPLFAHADRKKLTSPPH